LNNLKKAKPFGQVATLLILIIAAILIFTLIVANIGQVSNYATNLSNAADSASMYFASQIGTKSTQLSESLQKSCKNPVKCCVKTGLLSTILAIIVAIIAIVVSFFTFGAPAVTFVGFLMGGSTTLGISGAIVAIGAGIIGGAIGGAIGGGIAGTGALQGAIQGAAIGAAIGGGMALGAQAGLSVSLTGIPALGIPASALPSLATSALIGAGLGATLAAASNIYTAYAKDAMIGDAMAAAVKALQGLPETDRIRESIYLQALSSTIDDPNKIADTYDSDGDGNTTEKVSNFQYCWDRRIVALKQGALQAYNQQQTVVTAFLRDANSPVQKFINAINQFLPYLNRMEVEGSDGAVIELLRTLENAGYPVSFWEPGPSAAELSAWKAWDPNACPSCEPPNPPAGYDEVDYAIDEVGSDFMDEIETLKEQTDDQLVYNWKAWVPWFYEPEGTSDSYYDSLDSLINGDNSSEPVRIGLNGWVNEIERIRQGLPECVLGPDFITNPPCRSYPSNPTFGTIDADLEDEFQNAKDVINNFIQSVQEFRQACAQFYQTMESLEGLVEFGTSSCGLSGTNPITYAWDDSRGAHSIQVTLSSYNMPVIVKKKYGNWLKGKKCMELRYYQQDLNAAIERQDPTDVNVGVLGKWNPSSGGHIRRSSTAQYRGLARPADAWVKVIAR